jgi:hypothetical protein
MNASILFSARGVLCVAVCDWSGYTVTMLPRRTNEAEDTFVAQMGDALFSEIIDCAVLAVGEGRPVLAARLVGLLPDVAPEATPHPEVSPGPSLCVIPSHSA